MGTLSRLLTILVLAVAGCSPVPSGVGSQISSSTGATGTGPGPGREVPTQTATHVSKEQPHEPYNSTPPTSGPHWAVPGEAPVAWGIYEVPLASEALVHNLEHGGVVVYYTCENCDATLTQLENLFKRYVDENPLPRYPRSAKIILAPYPGLPNRITLTAWGRIDTLDEYDDQRILRFLEAYRDQGPEAVP